MRKRQQLTDSLRGRMLTEWPEGELLPGEHDLALEYGVSASTIANALNELRREDLWEGEKGRGRRVRKPRPPFAVYASRDEGSNAERIAAGVDVWVWEARQQGREGTQVIGEPYPAWATPEVARWLMLPPRSEVVIRPRVRFLDGRPDNINDTYYPADMADIVPEVRSRADVQMGVIALMRERGIVQVRFADELRWREPDEDERKRLDLPASISVLQQARTGYTAEGRAVKTTVTIWPGHNHRLVYELQDVTG